MGLIFGVIDFNRRPLCDDRLNAACRRTNAFAPDLFQSMKGESWFFAHADFISSPESRFERMPLNDPDSGTTVVAAGRLDNRRELLDRFAIPSGARPETPDGRLVFLAQREWGDDAPRHLRGDWSFAAWNEKTQSLFVARDQIGNTGIFYTFRNGLFAFSTLSALVFDLTGSPRQLNEGKLAQHLVIYPGTPGETIWKDVHTLPPACCLSVTRAGLQSATYWRMQDVHPRRLANESEYQEAFRHAFRAAVRSRMKNRGPVATQLSCGLDSSSVTAFAAEFAQESGGRIFAFTSVPAWPAEHLYPGSITDEWPIAHTVAQKFPNVVHIPIQAKDASPIRALHRTVEDQQMPVHAAVNYYWMYAVRREAERLGVRTMLTGQLGNGGVSWSGGANRIYELARAGRWKTAVRALRENRLHNQTGWYGAVRGHLLRPLLKPSVETLTQAWKGVEYRWQLYSAIHPDFARSIGVREKLRRTGRHAPFWIPMAPELERERTLTGNAASVGLLYHQENAMFPLQTLDPTADLDLLELCLAVPEELFTAQGATRAFLRTSMEGILPREVQWNRVRGKQGADITFRLLAFSTDVDEELARLAQSSVVGAYLSLPAMTHAWKQIQDRGTRVPDDGAISLLMRGLQTGIFLKRFFG